MTRVQLSDAEWQFIEPYLPVGEYGPYPERLRQQFEGVIWHFKSGSQWPETPREFGAWSTVHNRFRQWRDAGVFEALLEGAIAEAAKRGEVDLSLVSVDSTTVRARHDAAGMPRTPTPWRPWRKPPRRRSRTPRPGTPVSWPAEGGTPPSSPRWRSRRGWRSASAGLLRSRCAEDLAWRRWGRTVPSGAMPGRSLSPAGPAVRSAPPCCPSLRAWGRPGSGCARARPGRGRSPRRWRW